MPSVTVKALNFWRCQDVNLLALSPTVLVHHLPQRRPEDPTIRTARPRQAEVGGAPHSPPAVGLGSCLEEAEKSSRGARARSFAGPWGLAPEPPLTPDAIRLGGRDRDPRTGLKTAPAPGSSHGAIL